MSGPDLLPSAHSPDPDEPVLELSVSCTDLAAPTSSREPNSFVVASYVTPPRTRWTEHARTEVVEGSRRPGYLSSIAFFWEESSLTTSSSDGGSIGAFNGQTRVKLEVYHVEERTGTGQGAAAASAPVLLGSAQFRIDELLQTGHRLQLDLRSDGSEEDDKEEVGGVGKIVVKAWLTRNPNQGGETRSVAACRLSDSRGGPAPTPGVDGLPSGVATTTTATCASSEDVQLRRALYGHTVSRVYRLPAEGEEEEEEDSSLRSLRILEQMSESALSFHIPRQYLQLLLEEDAATLRRLDQLEAERLSARWEALRSGAASRYREMLLPAYRQALSHLDGYAGPAFKASRLKADPTLEFVPTNLHVQRMRVREEGEGEEGPGRESTYHVTTFGAPAAHCRGFKNGGLRRLVGRQESQDAEEDQHGGATERNGIAASRDMAGRIEALRSQVVDLAERLSEGFPQGNAQRRRRTMTLDAVAVRTRQLVALCDCKPLASASRALEEARAGTAADAPFSDNDDDSDDCGGSNNGHNSPTLPSKARPKVTESLEHVVRQAEKLLSKDDRKYVAATETHQQGDGGAAGEDEDEEAASLSEWREALQPLLTVLTEGVDAASREATKSATFLLMQDDNDAAATTDTSPLPPRYRRDVVFCQALTALVCGFTAELRSRLRDRGFLRQLGAAGLLAQFECLLSNYGEEPAMLEDMSVAVADLCRVTFRIVQREAHRAADHGKQRVDGIGSRATTSYLDDVLLLPTVSGSRDSVDVCVPLPAAMFDALPPELHQDNEERTVPIRVWPVLFSVGVNGRERIERLDTSLQDVVNAESLSRLDAYHRRVGELRQHDDSSEDERCSPRSASGTPLPELLERLARDVDASRGKPRSVDVLRRAAEACRRLGGVRFTSCRSAKDRTAMSVTLEQCLVARRLHGMAAGAFGRTLDCMRSEGCRRELPLKNCGRRLYAFDPARVHFLPELYRPPGGTFGKGET